MEKEEILAWIMVALVVVCFYFGWGFYLQHTRPGRIFKKWENPYGKKIQEEVDKLDEELRKFDYDKYMQEKYYKKWKAEHSYHEKEPAKGSPRFPEEAGIGL